RSQQELSGKMLRRVPATAAPGFGSLDHVSGDRTGKGHGGAFLKIRSVREIERTNLEFSAVRGYQANADTIAENAVPDARDHGAQDIPKLLVGDGLFGQFEQQFHAGLFPLQFRASARLRNAVGFQQLCRSWQRGRGETRVALFCARPRKVIQFHNNAPQKVLPDSLLHRSTSTPTRAEPLSARSGL